MKCKEQSFGFLGCCKSKHLTHSLKVDQEDKTGKQGTKSKKNHPMVFLLKTNVLQVYAVRLLRASRQWRLKKRRGNQL